MNIYSKLTLLSLFLVVISSSVLLFFVYKNITHSLKTEIKTSVAFETNNQLKTIDGHLNNRVSELNLLFETIENFESSQIELNRYLSSFKAANNTWHSLIYISPAGEAIAATSNFNLSQIKDIVARQKQSIELNPDLRNNNIIFSLKSSKNEILVGVIKSENFNQFLTEAENRTDLLLTNDGQIITGESQDLQKMEFINDNWTQLKASMATDNETVTIESPDLVMVSGSLKSSINASKIADWVLVTVRPAEGTYSPIADLKVKILWIVIPVFVGVIILALLMANYFVSPIIKLSEAASQIGKGNFTSPIDVSSNDEIGKLAKELNNTSKILISRIEQQNILNKQLEEQKNEILKQKDQIEETNYQITDSISYARRIQRSMLPDFDNISRLVSDAFVFFQPKDIVSGDFYWSERVRKGRNDYLVIACADCTGHGVPGAIMSIMGSNQLTNIVYYQNYLEPKKILARLDKNIKFELYRDDESSKTSIKDGMEIGICVINLDDYSMEYAGAGIPLYHYDGNELNVFKPVKEMAGGFEEVEERDVENKIIKVEVNLKKGDRIFLASDGFQDQFGGKEDKKYMVRNFRTLLLETSKLPLSEQNSKIKETFSSWKNNSSQTDDVLVMGFEF